MVTSERAALGLDFGTESVRALIVTLDGRELATGVSSFAHGQILNALPTGESLPSLFALQHPLDWMSSAVAATQEAVRQAGLNANQIVGIGVDFTSCTMLPTLRDGQPLCTLEAWQREPHAWAKLWKHHGAQEQTDRINQVARERNEAFLARYGGVIGLEWFFPKMLEVLEHAPAVFDATEVWLEAGDWFVWQLVGGDANALPRSTCQAGYKAMWSAEDGYPAVDFLRAVHPGLADVVRQKMPGKLVPPGTKAGELGDRAAQQFGLAAGTPVSAAIIDAHAGVPGAGAAEPGTLVMVMGTSSCHMLTSPENQFVPGVAGIVKDGILPGLYGYETGQAAVGDAFDWLRKLVGHDDHEQLAKRAASLLPGADGVSCLDWMNGCRTPLMDGSVSGAFSGLKMHHSAEHMYRALLEASAYGVKWIVDTLVEGGVPVGKFVATGGLPHHNPDLVQIYADVLGRTVTIHPSTQGPALGAAVLGALAAGESSGFASAAEAIEAMAAADSVGASGRGRLVQPNPDTQSAYATGYAQYRKLADFHSHTGE